MCFSLAVAVLVDFVTVSHRPELRKLLAVCDDEWKSLVMFRFCIGSRLGDLAMLTWQNLDLGSNERCYTSRKMQRTVIVSLANALLTAPALCTS